MFKTMIAALTVAAMAIPAHAQTFRAENMVRVTPVAGGLFSVESSPKFGVPGQWCAAADYAVRVRGANWQDRIFVQGKGPNRSVVFSIGAKGQTPKSVLSLSATANTPGANFTVQRAYAFCIEQRRPFQFFP